MNPYEPVSDFLKAVAAGDVSLSGSVFAAANRAKLIELTQDADTSNRDWAVMLLSQVEDARPDILVALRAAADDADPIVRAEAILGLAYRDPAIGFALVLRELDGGNCAVPILEAAAHLAEPKLIAALQPYAAPSDDPWLDRLVTDAVIACEKGAEAEHRAP